MIELVYGLDKEVAEFVYKAIPGCTPIVNCKAIGVLMNNEFIGGVVYHNWNPDAGVIELSAAATDPRWLLGPTLHKMFAYPFDEIGCQMVVLRVSERNSRMCKIAKRFGFEGYLIPRLRGIDENEYIFTLTAEQWRGTIQERKRNGKR